MGYGRKIPMNTDGSYFVSHGGVADMKEAPTVTPVTKPSRDMFNSTAAYGGNAAFDLWSGLSQASMIREQSRLTDQLNEMNAQFLDLDAFEAEKYSRQVAAQNETENTHILGSQRAALAGEGVDVNSGTAKDIQNESRLNGFLNTLDIVQQGRAKALGIRREARNMRLQSFMGDIEAQGRAVAATTQGISSAVQSGAKAYAAGG
jgi:hypothetical protein